MELPAFQRLERPGSEVDGVECEDGRENLLVAVRKRSGESGDSSSEELEEGVVSEH